MDILHDIRGKLNDRMTVFRDQSLKPVFYPVDIPDSIPVIKLHDQRPDDVVDTRAESATGDDGRLGLRRIEEDLLPWPGPLDGKGHTVRRLEAVVLIEEDVEQDFLGIRSEITDVYGGRNGACPQVLHG